MSRDINARIAYDAYGKTTKNFQGSPMPEFDALPPKIQEAWISASAAVSQPDDRLTDKQFRDQLVIHLIAAHMSSAKSRNADWDSDTIHRSFDIADAATAERARRDR